MEQSTPETLLFNDTSSVVQGLRFEDLDLDVLELGGELLWTPPSTESLVESYEVYVAKITTAQCEANMTPYAASNESDDIFDSNQTLFWCRLPLGAAQSYTYNWSGTILQSLMLYQGQCHRKLL